MKKLKIIYPTKVFNLVFPYSNTRTWTYTDSLCDKLHYKLDEFYIYQFSGQF